MGEEKKKGEREMTEKKKVKRDISTEEGEPRGGRPSRSDVDEQGQGKKQDVAGTSVNCDEGVDNDAQTGCVFGRGDEGSVEKSNAVDTSIVATILPVSEVVVQQEYVHTVSSAGGNVVTSDAGDPPSFVSVLPVDVKSNVVTDGVYVGSDSKENVVSSSVGCGKDSVYGAFSTSGADSVSFSFDPSFVEESQFCEFAALSAVGWLLCALLLTKNWLPNLLFLHGFAGIKGTNWFMVPKGWLRNVFG
ncbi:hypothetical protein ACOSQ4_014688 [Xanthoceras sorbifolium]